MFSIFKSFSNAKSGKQFGNDVADYLNIDRNLYHSAMEAGGFKGHLIHLHKAKEANADIHTMALYSFDYVSDGLDAIEARFGRQDLIDNARVALKTFLDQLKDSEK